jgi:hypothetical protein
MPYAVITEWPDGGRDTRNYDAITRRMDVRADPPEGLIAHAAGATPEGGFRISDVWETREAYEAFHAGRLTPAIDEVMAGLPAERRARATPPAVTVYELHDVIVPAAAAARA